MEGFSKSAIILQVNMSQEFQLVGLETCSPAIHGSFGVTPRFFFGTLSPLLVTWTCYFDWSRVRETTKHG